MSSQVTYCKPNKFDLQLGRQAIPKVDLPRILSWNPSFSSRSNRYTLDLYGRHQKIQNLRVPRRWTAKHFLTSDPVGYTLNILGEETRRSKLQSLRRRLTELLTSALVRYTSIPAACARAPTSLRPLRHFPSPSPQSPLSNSQRPPSG